MNKKPEELTDKDIEWLNKLDKFMIPFKKGLVLQCVACLDYFPSSNKEDYNKFKDGFKCPACFYLDIRLQ